MVKLTRTGKIALGVVLVIFCGLIYFLFFRGDPPPATDTEGIALTDPAPVPKGFKFPLSKEASLKWQQEAAPTRDKLSYCSFFSADFGGAYEENRNVPLDFVAILAPDARQTPYYYRDPETKRSYYPVYPIGAGSEGLKQALAAASGDTESVKECALGADEGAVPVVVAFPPGENPPSGGLLRIKGYMAWQFGYVKADVPDQQAPVVNAGEVTAASAQQALSPATYERILNISMRRGPVVMRLSRVEFSPEQTRVWVELWNTSPRPLDAWEGITSATLQERGAPAVKATGAQEDTTGADQLGDLDVTNDILQSTEVPAASGTPGKVSGFLVFPSVNPDKVVELFMPDPYPGDNGDGGNNITVKLLPGLNKQL